MKNISKTYKKRFLLQGITLSATTIFEITSFILLISHDFDFISKTSTSQAIIGAVFGFSVLVTIYIAIFIYKQYRESIEFRYEKLLQETEIKFEILRAELEKQKEELLMMTENNEMKSSIAEYIAQIEKEKMSLQRDKLEEIKKTIEKFQFDEEKISKN